jgi:hypothetical protein
LLPFLGDDTKLIEGESTDVSDVTASVFKKKYVTAKWPGAIHMDTRSSMSHLAYKMETANFRNVS